MRTRATDRIRHGRAALVLAITVALAPSLGSAGAGTRRQPRPAPAVEAGSVPFQRAAGRIVVTLTFVRPDRQTRSALAWVNMGTPIMALAAPLARELDVGEGRPLAFRLGSLDVTVGPERLAVGAPRLDGEDALAHLFAPLPVEAILPASVLARYRLTLDMPGGRLTLAPPDAVAPQGVAVPICVNPDTGVIAVEADVAGERHLLALDAGASFTWARGALVRRWLGGHPDWLRAEGAVGPSNMGLTRLDLERRGLLVRLPAVRLADRLTLPDVAALGTAPLLCGLCERVVGDLFWDGWQRDAPGPVAGWLGADALAGVRLTVDYPNRTLYWQREGPPASPGIAQVGVTLERHGGAYAVGGIVIKQGRPTVESVEPGDRLLAVDGKPMRDLPSDEVLRALGGQPGTSHLLTLGRAGGTLEVSAPITAF